MKWIIVDSRKLTALYGVEGKTLNFSTKEIAIEVANQFFISDEHFIVISINF